MDFKLIGEGEIKFPEPGQETRIQELKILFDMCIDQIFDSAEFQTGNERKPVYRSNVPLSELFDQMS